MSVPMPDGQVPDLALAAADLPEPVTRMVVVTTNFPYIEAALHANMTEFVAYLQGIRDSLPQLEYSVAMWDPDADEPMVELTTRAPEGITEEEPPAEPPAT